MPVNRKLLSIGYGAGRAPRRTWNAPGSPSGRSLTRRGLLPRERGNRALAAAARQLSADVGHPVEARAGDVKNRPVAACG
jgi:hypothetical protein